MSATKPNGASFGNGSYTGPSASGPSAMVEAEVRKWKLLEEAGDASVRGDTVPELRTSKTLAEQKDARVQNNPMFSIHGEQVRRPGDRHLRGPTGSPAGSCTSRGTGSIPAALFGSGSTRQAVLGDVLTPGMAWEGSWAGAGCRHVARAATRQAPGAQHIPALSLKAEPAAWHPATPPAVSMAPMASRGAARATLTAGGAAPRHLGAHLLRRHQRPAEVQANRLRLEHQGNERRRCARMGRRHAAGAVVLRALSPGTTHAVKEAIQKGARTRR